MKISKVYIHQDSWGEINWVSFRREYEGKTITVKLIPGNHYLVEPINPQKKKHRGRICTIIGFEQNDIRDPLKILVQFSDNNRHGKVSIDDLLEFKRQRKKDRQPEPFVLFIKELNQSKEVF
ncbi:hypothetical protein P4U99_20740 [Brevibacillus agri]|uniref:hypothetical protein n=1 Tax=Brevibacillus agri TaxID=51101 RepID=UPI002E1A475F|nr:hypothetical protein [Brevibacillus agri]MED1657839.1 hypothetical protein [Brevibacillus agri]MED1689764.1 hypothetical protein [Brevibacillus agri]MED1695524.1 hypothetical protein [Brevibacillus agri]MED1695730.1 hypothetical protein [Brevibacillus agri]